MTTARSIVVFAPDRDAGLEHDAAAHARAVGDPAAALDERGRDDPPLALDRLLDDEVAVARTLGERGPDRALEDVEGRLEVALGRPDVEPVVSLAQP